MSQVIECPECSHPLRVPEEHFGKKVECPKCFHLFDVSSKGTVSRSGFSSVPPAPKSAPKERDREEEDDRPRRRRYEEDDDFDDDHPRRSRRNLEPHRGGTILALGVLSIFFFGIILGTIAWVMGNNDLHRMDQGFMDPAGRSDTQTGKTIGMVMVIIHLVSILAVFTCLCMIFGVGAARR